eukprot:TRINITY_DN495_c0_g1_i1.p1 TRINITY_DN495_c0_g1~~TRINITY_DN495_c0_g1_i1.p1  ORF type:complete len:432 (-),score=94.42 TRINITY_DN495_c0_g1_i1:670-1965(-)
MPSQRALAATAVQLTDQYEVIVDTIKAKGSPVYTHVSKSAPPDHPPPQLIPGQWVIRYGQLQESTGIPGLALLLKKMKTAAVAGQVIDFTPVIVEDPEEMITLLPHQPTLETFKATAKSTTTTGTSEDGNTATITTHITGTDHTISNANSTQLLLTSLLSCDQEQATLIAKEELGVELWGEVQAQAVLETAAEDSEAGDNNNNTTTTTSGDGGGTQSVFPRPHVPYRKVTITAVVQTSASQAVIDDIVNKVSIRCPIRTLLTGAGTEIVTQWSKAAPLIQEYSLTAQGEGMGPVCHARADSYTLVADEAAEDGGSDQGPNPVQHLMSSLLAAGHALARRIALQELGIESWGPVKSTGRVTVNLDGVLGQGDLTQPLSPSAFTSAGVDSVVLTSASDEEVKRVQAMVSTRCPIRQLFAGAGCGVVDVWSKAV